MMKLSLTKLLMLLVAVCGCSFAIENCTQIHDEFSIWKYSSRHQCIAKCLECLCLDQETQFHKCVSDCDRLYFHYNLVGLPDDHCTKYL